MAKELRVLIAGGEIGSVFQGAHGRLRFVYDNVWQNTIDSYPLSLSMPLTQREHERAPIENYIWGLLSDDPETRAEMARREGVSPQSAFALVMAYGEDLAGAVQMVPPEQLDKLARKQGLARISEKRLAEFLANLVKHPGQIQIRKEGGKFSLPGAQPKKAICLVDGKWYEPRGRTPSTHIIKPPSPHLDHQVENEYFCAKLAAAVGLRVADTKIVRIGDASNILVQRYDRARILRGRQIPLDESGGTVHRVHQEDLCQALSFSPEKKYQRDGGPTMKAIMDLLTGSGDAAADRERFMRACMFNFVMLGVDAHAKNFSILFEPGWRFRLAPLYDVISALPYDQAYYDTLAMKVGGEGKWRNIGPSKWEKEAKACRYSVDTTFAFLKLLIEQLPARAEKILSETKSSGLHVPFLEALSTQVTTRCRKLRASYGEVLR